MDPKGDTEVCVGNMDIADINLEPANMNGFLEKLRLGEEGATATYVGTGSKISLLPLSIKDATRAYPDIKVSLVSVPEEDGQILLHEVDQHRCSTLNYPLPKS